MGLPKSTGKLAPVSGTWVRHEGFGQRDGAEHEVDQLWTHGDQEADLWLLNPGRRNRQRSQVW